MREKSPDCIRTLLLEHTEREEALRLMNESGDPAPVDMAVFSRRIGQIIVHAKTTDKRS